MTILETNGYLVLKLMTECDIGDTQWSMNLTNQNERLVGVCPVFRTKKAAMKSAGKDHEIIPIHIGEEAPCDHRD